jgi:hypothetical protein
LTSAHSHRKATIGSTFVARRAGIQRANNAAPVGNYEIRMTRFEMKLTTRAGGDMSGFGIAISQNRSGDENSPAYQHSARIAHSSQIKKFGVSDSYALVGASVGGLETIDYSSTVSMQMKLSARSQRRID